METDKLLGKIRQIIAAQGWAVQAVLPGENSPGFAYTVGLSDKGSPELIMTGYHPEYMQDVLNDLAARLVKGERFCAGDTDPFFPTANIFFLAVDERKNKYLLAVKNLCGKIGDVLQVVVPDAQGHYPWDPQCDPQLQRLQVLLGEPPRGH